MNNSDVSLTECTEAWGRALAARMDGRKLEIEALAKTMQVSREDVNAWRLGARLVPQHRLDDLCRALGLDAKRERKETCRPCKQFVSLYNAAVKSLENSPLLINYEDAYITHPYKSLQDEKSERYDGRQARNNHAFRHAIKPTTLSWDAVRDTQDLAEYVELYLRMKGKTAREFKDAGGVDLRHLLQDSTVAGGHYLFDVRLIPKLAEYLGMVGEPRTYFFNHYGKKMEEAPVSKLVRLYCNAYLSRFAYHEQGAEKSKQSANTDIPGESDIAYGVWVNNRAPRALSETLLTQASTLNAFLRGCMIFTGTTYEQTPVVNGIHGDSTEASIRRIKNYVNSILVRYGHEFPFDKKHFGDLIENFRKCDRKEEWQLDIASMSPAPETIEKAVKELFPNVQAVEVGHDMRGIKMPKPKAKPNGIGDRQAGNIGRGWEIEDAHGGKANGKPQLKVVGLPEMQATWESDEAEEKAINCNGAEPHSNDHSTNGGDSNGFAEKVTKRRKTEAKGRSRGGAAKPDLTGLADAAQPAD